MYRTRNMEKTHSNEIKKFGIQIDGIDLPKEVMDRIGSELMNIVLKNIAELDLARPGSKISSTQDPVPARSIPVSQLISKKGWNGGRIVNLSKFSHLKVGDILNTKVVEDFQLSELMP